MEDGTGLAHLQFDLKDRIKELVAMHLEINYKVNSRTLRSYGIDANGMLLAIM